MKLYQCDFPECSETTTDLFTWACFCPTLRQGETIAFGAVPVAGNFMAILTGLQETYLHWCPKHTKLLKQKERVEAKKGDTA